MKKIASLLIVLLVPAWLHATPVGPMSYQGRLLDTQGIPVTGAYDFIVSVYDDPAAGALQYQETLSNVQVNDGVYSFKVGLGPKTGGTEEWDTNLWQGNLNNLHLELEVSVHNAGSYDTLSPRTELTSAPHAFTATLALALGNKTAEEFDNILEGVCSASRGKWLDNIERCLGVGATVTNEDAATMASDLDYSDLDVSDADMTDTVFANADFSNSLFKDTTLTIGNFSNANMTGVRFDNVTSTNTMPNITINFTDATITNMNLSGWDFSNATLNGLSAANLTACPGTVDVAGSNLPANWICTEMIQGSGRYILLGPGVNISADSEAAISKHGFRLLDLDKDTLQWLNLDGASLEGIDLSNMEVRYNTIQNANMDFTTINAGIFAQTQVYGSSFRYSTISNIDLEHADFGNNNFENAVLEDVQFTDVDDMNFDRSKLTRVTFTDVLANPSFVETYFDNSTFQNDITGSLDLTGARIYNTTNFGFAGPTPLSASPQNVDNMEVRSFGDPGSFQFMFLPGVTVDGLYMEDLNLTSTDFNGSTFTNCEIHNSTSTNAMGIYNTTNATFDGCVLNGIDWGCEGTNYQINIINSTLIGNGFGLNAIGFSTGLDDSCSLGGSAITDPGFLNVDFQDVQFEGNWSYIVSQTCSGCTFTNTSWSQMATCPDGSGPVETPPASGTYQCSGWY